MKWTWIDVNWIMNWRELIVNWHEIKAEPMWIVYELNPELIWIIHELAWNEHWNVLRWLWINMNQYEPVCNTIAATMKYYELIWIKLSSRDFPSIVLAIPTHETLLSLPLPQGTRATLNLITIRWWRDCTISVNREIATSLSTVAGASYRGMDDLRRCSRRRASGNRS